MYSSWGLSILHVLLGGGSRRGGFCAGGWWGPTVGSLGG